MPIDQLMPWEEGLSNREHINIYMYMYISII